MTRLLVISLPGNLWAETAGLEAIDSGGWGGGLKIHVKASQQALKRPFYLAPVPELVNLVRVLQGVTQSDICSQYAILKASVGQGLKGIQFLGGLFKGSRRNKLTNQNPFEYI